MARIHEGDLAWDIVERHRSSLDIGELNKVFLKLGTGDYAPVIDMLLTAIVRNHDSLSPDLIPRIDLWVDVYDGHEQQYKRRYLLGLASTAADGGIQMNEQPHR
jgi:hypothetical protein